ncbi:MAG: MFS transporter [Phycisphaeraceae bacterium]|nr:MAG: MFS transporter [Phycisphaeraceae bacterium]
MSDGSSGRTARVGGAGGDGGDRHDAYAALRHANYRLFASGFLCSSTGLQMMGMALGWEVYERTGDALMLGLVGLARALPVVVAALPAGHVIDRVDRRRVLIGTQGAFAVAAGLLALASWLGASVWVLIGLVSLAGVARTFNGPVRSSLLPDIVPGRDFANAVTWNSGVFQLSAMAGPLLAGVVIAWSGSAWVVYALTAGLCGVFAVTGVFIRPHTTRVASEVRERLGEGVRRGLRHVWREKTILSVITLDLFAVLFGGATALLPIYAKDILEVGPVGLGWLRASPFLGALVMALWLAHRPIRRGAGPLMLWSVAGFGACTVVFGLSREVWLSVGALVALGALDSVSVVIRHVLVQARTPRSLRGRVSSVNSVFIECSNELGAFESGAVAKAFAGTLGVAGGAVVSVVSGGVGTMLVVACVAAAWPQIRRLDRLDEPMDGEGARCPSCDACVPADRTAARPLGQGAGAEGPGVCASCGSEVLTTASAGRS